MNSIYKSEVACIEYLAAKSRSRRTLRIAGNPFFFSIGPQHRRTLLSTGAWLSALTIFAFVSWLYVFREGGTSTRVETPDTAFEPVVVPVPAPGVITKSALPVLSTTTSTAAGVETEIATTTSLSASKAIVSSSTSARLETSTPAMKSHASAAPGPKVKLRQGTYQGTTCPSSANYPKAIESWLGIPYAQDTSGENRFRLAQPVPESKETFDADVFGPTCLGSWSGLPESEDCLGLNIHRPQGSVIPGEVAGQAKTSPLPVVVYVHGGSFNTGHGGERNMASFVSWAKEDILAVGFNYRIGPFGFLPSALTAREGLLNLGLKDQQALFRWVRENIASFGGDPENVTIMGLSAGGHSVGHHVMYYGNSSAPVPFQKAILESGATTARAVFYPTHPRHLVQFREFLVAAGVEGVPEGKVLDALRKLDGKTLNDASKKIWWKYSNSVTWPFQPVIDGPNLLANSSHVDGSLSEAAIPDLPLNSWRNGRHLQIPVLTGFNTNEGTMFIPPKADTNEEFRSFFSHLIPAFSKKDLDDLEKLYPDPVTDPSSPHKTVPEGMGRQWTRLDAAYSHYAYICPVLQTAHFLSTAGDTKTSPTFSKSTHAKRNYRPPVYVYQYAATSKHGTANHGDEAAIVAHDMNVISPPTPEKADYKDAVDSDATSHRPGLRAISDAMHTAWVNFIVSKDGNPNPFSQAGEWPAFTSPFEQGTGKVVVFGRGNDERVAEKGKISAAGTPVVVGSLDAWDIKACHFWWERGELSQGLGGKLHRGRL